MGELVDVVGLAVAPVLEEFGRGPSVIDLVEVHPIGLRQAERAQDETRHDEDDEEPQVEPVETARRARRAGARDRSARRARTAPSPNGRGRPPDGSCPLATCRRPSGRGRTGGRGGRMIGTSAGRRRRRPSQSTSSAASPSRSHSASRSVSTRPQPSHGLRPQLGERPTNTATWPATIRPTPSGERIASPIPSHP